MHVLARDFLFATGRWAVSAPTWRSEQPPVAIEEARTCQGGAGCRLLEWRHGARGFMPLRNIVCDGVLGFRTSDRVVGRPPDLPISLVFTGETPSGLCAEGIA